MTPTPRPSTSRRDPLFNVAPHRPYVAPVVGAIVALIALSAFAVAFLVGIWVGLGALAGLVVRAFRWGAGL